MIPKFVLPILILLVQLAGAMPPQYPKNIRPLPPELIWSAPAKPPTPIKEAAIGLDHSVFLYTDGTIHCQGGNEWGQCDAPPGLKDVAAVAAGAYASAAVLKSGEVLGWGTQAGNKPDGMQGAAIQMSENVLYVLTRDGRIWSGKKGFLRIKGKAAQFAIGEHDSVWYVDTEGSVFNGEESADQVPVFTGAASVTTTSLLGFALMKDGSVLSQGQPGYPLKISGKVPKMRKLAGSGSSLYGLLEDGSGVEFRNGTEAIIWPKSKVPAVNLFGGKNGVLIVMGDGTVGAHGDSKCGHLRIGPGGLPVSRVKCTADGGCLYFGPDGLAAGCAGRSHFSPSLGPPLGLASVRDADGYHHFGIAVKKDGTLLTWGDNGSGFCDVPAGLGKVSEVRCSREFVLALTVNGKVAQWGNALPHVPLPAPPQIKEKVTAIAAGWGFAMALTRTGDVITWGKRAPDPHAGLPPVTAIAASYLHALALSADGRVFTWGGNALGECNVPADLPPAMGIACGWSHSVALLKDGTLRAWGKHRPLPPNLPKLQSISASFDQIAGVTPDGSAICFSVREDGEGKVNTVLKGVFKSIPVEGK